MQTYADKSDDYFAHARREIAPWLPKNCGQVLEIGCGSGATLAWLRQVGCATRTVGVEISEVAAQSARAHADEVHCLDFERVEIPVAGAKFDLILCLDVLEHMVNPWQAIERLVSLYLVPGGTMIVSLPNVGHYSVVLPLLFQGRWDYQDAGLLDRTHLRFFTRRTAKRLLSHPDLGASHCMARGFERTSLKGILNMLTAGVFADLFTYQYYLTACKKV